MNFEIVDVLVDENMTPASCRRGRESRNREDLK